MNKEASFFSKLLLALFALSLGITASMSWWTADGVLEPLAFVNALKMQGDKVKKGDRVLIHPPWRDDVISAFKASVDVDFDVEPTLAFAKRHQKKVGRFWLVQDASAPGLSKALLRRIGQTKASGIDAHFTEENGVRVQLVDDSKRLKRASVKNVKDFKGLLPFAEVRVEGGAQKVIRCHFNDDKERHLCAGLSSWMWVGEKSQVIKGRSRDCIWSHPISGGKVRIRFTDVLFSMDDIDKGLIFEHALADSATSNAAGKNVVASIWVDGKVKKRFTRTNRRGFSSGVVSLKGVNPSMRHSVEVQVETANDGARHYCWNLRKGG